MILLSNTYKTNYEAYNLKISHTLFKAFYSNVRDFVSLEKGLLYIKIYVRVIYGPVKLHLLLKLDES